MKRTMLCVLVTTTLALLPVSGEASDLGPAVCGDLANGYGPLDYRTATPEQRVLVEGAHFTPAVEALMRGKTAATAGSDIDYTLRVYPNHHRALLAVINLGIKEKRSKPVGMRYTVECWLERGERFKPDDPMVKMLYGIFLVRNGRSTEALEKLAEAEKADDPDNPSPNLYYNLGLTYFEMKRYDIALSNAHKAYAFNYPLAGLRDKLKRIGQWRELPPRSEVSAPLVPASAP